MKTIITRRVGRLFALASAALLVGTGVAYATGNVIGADNTINGCYRVAEDDRKGELRVVNDPASCRSNEFPIAWNVQGPKGDPGTPGPKGDPGPAGPSGVSTTYSVRHAHGPTGQAVAWCQPGEQVTGGGGAPLNPAEPNIALLSSYPTRFDLPGAFAEGTNARGWLVRSRSEGTVAFVVCAS